MTYPDDIHVALSGGRGYPVRFAPLAAIPGALDQLGIARRRVVVVTDGNVAGHYLDALADGLRAGGEVLTHVVPAGEASKSAARLQTLYDAALGWGVERDTLVVALGGGVVGDLAGFAAATLLRGIPVVQVPTSLIAQVDSAIGGKTGINHTAGKNLIGAFHQPRAVFVDPSVMRTLPMREWASGLAEAVKHALIADAELFDTMAADWDAWLRRDLDRIVPHLGRVLRVKAEVVARDEFEGGARALLNFGHTFAHAIERVSGYGTFTHGEAVVLGMRAALVLSRALRPAFDPLPALGLLERIPVVPTTRSLDRRALMEAMRTDKKVRDGDLRFIVLTAIGHAHVAAGVPPDQVAHAWDSILAE